MEDWRARGTEKKATDEASQGILAHSKLQILEMILLFLLVNPGVPTLIICFNHRLLQVRKVNMLHSGCKHQPSHLVVQTSQLTPVVAGLSELGSLTHFNFKYQAYTALTQAIANSQLPGSLQFAHQVQPARCLINLQYLQRENQDNLKGYIWTAWPCEWLG